MSLYASDNIVIDVGNRVLAVDSEWITLPCNNSAYTTIINDSGHFDIQLITATVYQTPMN